MDDFSFDLSAASWRHAHADERTYVEALAERLEKSLPDLVRVKREHKWFAKTQAISELEVLLGERTYMLSLENDRFVSRVAHSVGGVVLNRKAVSMPEWLDGLSRELSEVARADQDLRKSMEDFLL